MAIYYMDSSSVVKRYANEVGSAWTIAITNPSARHEIYVARITGVEVVSALTRRSRGGAIEPVDAASAIAQLKSDLQNEYQVLEVTEALVDRAMSLAETHGLRGYDAVQLSAACELHALLSLSELLPLTFVAADQALIAAAASEGLAVDEPNAHP